MHLLRGKAPCQLAQEGLHLLMPVVPSAGIVDLARVEVQGRHQREGAVVDDACILQA